MTLTEISYYLRRFLPFAVLIFLVFLIFFYSIRLFFILNQNKAPTVETNVVFGKIKRPTLKDVPQSAAIDFTFDTIEGEPVTATSAAKVIFLPPPKTSFGYLEKIYLSAKSFDFDTEVVKHQLQDNELVFEEPMKKLSMDRSNFNFNYQYFFDKTPEIFDQAIRPDRPRSQTEATNFLRGIGRYPEELAQGKTDIKFLLYDTKTKTMTILPNNIGANLAEVDFYRPDIDGFPTVSPSYFDSQNFVLLKFDETEHKILRAQIKFFEKSDEQVGFYPLRTGKDAYESLKKGKGFVVANPEAKKNVIIKKMFLAYLDPDIYQDYMQPVYVFLGENKFVAYVPAVSEDYLTD